MLKIARWPWVHPIIIGLFMILTGCSGSSSAPSTVSGPSRAASVLQQDIAIADNPEDESQSAIAYNTQANNYLVVWARTNDDTSKDIIGKVCTGSDTTGQGNPDNVTSVSCGAEFDIANDVGTTQENPKVAYSPSQNRYLVVWQDTRNVDYSQIYGQFVSGAGQVITKVGAAGFQNFAISTHVDGVDQSQTKPEIIYNHVKNKFVTAWVDKSTYDSANVVTLSGSGCVNDITISYVPPSAADNNIIRTKEIDPALGGLSATDHASELVFSQVFGDDGSKITAAWRAQINETSPKVVVDQSGTNIIAWSGQNNDITMELGYTKDADTGVCTYKSPVYKTTNTDSTKNKIKIRRKDLNLVKDYSFGNNVASIAMGINGAQNKLLLAWEDNTETGLKPLDIKGQLFDLTSFTTYGPVLDIAVAVGNQSSPAVAFDPANERFFVTWDDGRNESDNISNMDVYGQFIDKTGNLSGGNTIVTMEPGNQGTPQVAFGDTDFRKFFVVWNDGRNPATADIYGQMIEFSTYPQLIIADEAGVAILNGAQDFGTVTVGTTKDIKFRIKNDGNSQLYISDVSTPDAPYSFVTVKPTTVSPGTYADLIVRFSPMAAGSYSGAPANNFKVVLKSNGGQATLYFSGTGSGNQPVEITTSSLANGSPNATYPQKVEARYGVYPYTWSLVQGTVPTGLTFTSQGSFTGTIGGATSGVFNFTVRVTDSEGVTAERALSISVSALSITSTSLKSWTVNRDYGAAPVQSLQAAGGTGVFAWTADGLPNGLSIDPATGSLTGVPTVPGSFPATFSVSSGGQTVNKSLTININQAVVMTQTTFPTGVVNESYLHRLALQGGTAPFTWTLVSAPLPPGISFDSAAAEFAGTPTQPGTWSFVVKATDASGATTGNQTLSITVNPALDIQEAAGPIDNATAGTPYSFSFHPGGGRGPYKWAIQGNGLPTGLELNADTGKVTGTPVNSGEYSFTVAVTDSGNNTVAKTFTINVQDPLQSQSASVDFGDVAASLTKKLSVTIINGGVSEITVTDATTNNAAFAVSNKPSSLKLAQNQTSTIDVVFSPAADQAYSGKLLVKSSGGDLSIPLTGTGVPQPVIAVSSNQVGIGQVPSNSQKTSTFTISNTGLAPLTVTAINGATSPFSLDVATPFTLAPGATQDVGVTVVGTDTGALSRKLTIVSDAVNVINPIDVTATVVGNIAFVVDGVQKSSLIFGNVFAGTSSPAKTVSVRNNGSGAVTLASAAFNTGDGFKSSFNAPQTLAAGKTYLFTVTFTPQEDEPYEDTLILKDDVNTQFQLAMTGNGMPVAVALPGVTQAVVASTVPLEPEDLPNEAKPVGFVASEGVDFTLTGAGPNETVEVEVTFANEEIPEDAVFYKVMPDSSWVLLSQVAGNYTRTGNTIRFTIQNDSSLDWDKTNPGVIRDPIVVGRVSGSGTGTGAPSSGGGGGGCFIATAAFGSYLDPHVMVLRNFRDNVLLQTGPGTAFVTFYYKYSPPVADFIRDHESLRIVTRWLLTPLIVSVKYPLAAMAFGLLLMSAGIYRLRRKERISAAVVMENGR